MADLTNTIKSVLGTYDLSKINLDDLTSILVNAIEESETEDKSSHELVLEQVEELVFKHSDVEDQLKAVASLPVPVFNMVQEDLHMTGFERLARDRVYDLKDAKVIVTENGVFYAEWN